MYPSKVNVSSFGYVSWRQIISNLDSLDLIDLMLNFVFEMVCFVGLSLVFRP